jgi:parallel beta-helix repeat protein
MLRKFFLLTLVIGLVAFGCSGNDSIVSSNSSDMGELSEVSEDFAAFVTEAVESEDYNSDEVAPLLKRGHYFGYQSISGPTTITRPGIYYLESDFSTPDDGIVIQSNFVILNLGDHTISGPGNKSGRGVVIDHSKYVIVYGGNFEQFGTGVMFDEASRSSVRYAEIMGGDEIADPSAGIAPQIGIMLKNSSRNWIFGNKISMTNLGIFVRGGGSSRNKIYHNKAMGGDRGLLAICYNPVPGEGGAGPSRDNIRFNYLSRFGSGIQTSEGSEKNSFLFNTIKYFDEAYRDFNGSNKFKRNETMQLDPPSTDVLVLSFEGLQDLGSDYVYEGWIIVAGSPVTTGTFTVDDMGNASQTHFELSTADLMLATKFVLTIEPSVDPDPAPASTHYLAGDFSSGSASLTVADPAALGNDFLSAVGPYILNTPSTGSDDSDYHAGIWWLDPMAGPGATLELPTLPPGWEYEGWVVGPGGPVTTGKFVAVDVVDFDAGGPTAGPDPIPPFPGQDYINPLMSLIGYTAVISIEPMPDNSSAPFALKPLVDMTIDDVSIGVLQDMSNNASSFPTGSANK